VVFPTTLYRDSASHISFQVVCQENLFFDICPILVQEYKRSYRNNILLPIMGGMGMNPHLANNGGVAFHRELRS